MTTTTTHPTITITHGADGHWTFTYDHGDDRRFFGGACTLRDALDGIERAHAGMLAEDAARAAGRVCRLCGAGVTSTNPTCDVCRMCFYHGADKAAARTMMLDEIRAVPGVNTAGIVHTGGGCFALEILLHDNAVMVCTNGDAGVPEHSWDRWGYVGLFANDDAQMYGETIDERETETWTGPADDGDDSTPLGWTDAQLVDVVRELLAAQ